MPPMGPLPPRGPRPKGCCGCGCLTFLMSIFAAFGLLLGVASGKKNK